MSHYSKIQTEICDREALLKALQEMGYGTIEVHSSPQHLYGYEGDRRPEQAEIIVRRKYISQLSNDIGFRRTSGGTYEALLSEYDEAMLGTDWLGRVVSKYAYNVVVSKMEAQGFTLSEKEVDPVTKKIHLVMRRCG